ncbi:SapC family protein [Shewanella inventionis]|uniref:Peptidase n=1 Tax=Shewanella inventionis TaxID=1738770 RepID=A0ABQ1J836_9GAMM|nr:SapC family protein [Shewanella inventionis]MCL1159158.1 SapC family protein [Shewanella inventionis]UAL45053.1 SapC family protein [Shewanella inventionis]GGB61885.1 peptidase [Shewanella inventionis]
MTQHVLLNSIDHKDLKINTSRSAALGDNLWYSVTFPQEFRSIQAHYPIFFHKDATTGQFYSVALFGFTQNENLFLSNEGWNASYIPLTVRRQPFLIGQQTVREDGVERQQRVIHIDLDHPRVSQTEGEALFLPYGGNTPLLDEVGEMLELIHHGLIDNQQFIEALIKHELLESFTLDIELDNGKKHQMIGFYTINENTLATLSADTLATLHQQGYLQAIFMALASQSKVRDLLNLKNAQG